MIDTTLISPRMLDAGIAELSGFDRFDDSDETKAEMVAAIDTAMHAKLVESLEG